MSAPFTTSAYDLPQDDVPRPSAFDLLLSASALLADAGQQLPNRSSLQRKKRCRSPSPIPTRSSSRAALDPGLSPTSGNNRQSIACSEKEREGVDDEHAWGNFVVSSAAVPLLAGNREGGASSLPAASNVVGVEMEGKGSEGSSAGLLAKTAPGKGARAHGFKGCPVCKTTFRAGAAGTTSAVRHMSMSVRCGIVNNLSLWSLEQSQEVIDALRRLNRDIVVKEDGTVEVHVAGRG